MDLTLLSKEELQKNLQCLEARKCNEDATSRRRQALDAVQELEVLRIELEMQNRALRDTQTELELAVRRYQDLYDHLPIGYVTLTPSGRIVESNRTAASWLRRDRLKLRGVYMNWFLDAFDAGRFAAHLEACLQSRTEEILHDATLRLENGLRMTVQFASRIAPEEPGAETHIHTALTQVSRFKQAQALIDDITREQNALTDSISHDSRAPLIAISQFSRSILDDHASALSDEIRNMVERIDCAAVRVEATLHHLLEFCCLGGEEIALAPVNLDEVVQQVMLEFRGTIEQRAAAVAVARPLPCVRGARLMLAQVLMNLLADAIKHRLGDGPPQVRIAAEEGENVVVLKIANEGQRVDPQENNFRLFERMHGGSTYFGNGIGFAIVRRAVERMKGRVWVDSAVEQGDCFNIELPKV